MRLVLLMAAIAITSPALAQEAVELVPVELPAPAQSEEKPPGQEPLQNWLSGYVAGFGYNNHSFRYGGAEAQARVDLWRGLTWSAHVSYTPTAIVELDESGSQTTVFFHDFLLGGRWAPFSTLPVWFWGEAHGLLGSTTYGSGGAFLGGAGGQFGNLRLELGAGGVFLQGDRGLNVLTQASYRFTPWLELSLLGHLTTNHPDDSTYGTGGTHLAYGAAVKLGPFKDVSIELRWIGGERVLAMDHLGTVVENLPDTQKDTASATVSFPIIDGAWMSVGTTFRSAYETSGQHYYQATGLVGLGVSY